MQDYYERHDTFASENNVKMKLTTVGTLFQVLTFAFIFVANIIYSFCGYRYVLFTGIILSALGLILASLATSIWQLYLAVSLCTGCGVACFSTVGLRILPQWFEKRRSTAFGIQAGIYAITALVVPFIIIAINNKLGAHWTFRILGFVFLVINVSSIVLIKERVIPSLPKKKPALHFMRIFRNLSIMMWIAVGPIQIYASYTTFVFLPSYSTFIGLSEVQGGATVAILSATGAVGRIVTGLIGDKFGNLNTYIVCMIVATISVLVIWVFAHSFATLIVFALVNGLVYGSYLTLAAPVAINIVGMEDYPAAVSINMLAFGLSVFGPLLASYMESHSQQEPFLYCKIIAGVGYGACALISIILKFRLSRSVRTKV
ncbi:major facilitator superfamily domain-containing protein [Fennellomyces sp. T-0311]|nr:major facilitator superfamily domain-containing protein [Fennellomyces sp. T-0311]